MAFLRTHQPYSGTEVLMETKLERIAEISASSPRPEFTSLYQFAESKDSGGSGDSGSGNIPEEMEAEMPFR